MPPFGYKKRRAKWTKEDIIEKIQEWHSLYGQVPAASDWRPDHMLLRARRQSSKAQAWMARRTRYYEGEWPFAASVAKIFGGWNNALIAAGFEPDGDPRYMEPTSVNVDTDVPGIGTLRRLQRLIEESDTRPERDQHLLELATTAIAIALEPEQEKAEPELSAAA